MSPSNHLARVFLCNSMRMQVRSEACVTEIAFACGFNDSNYFSSRFHKALGFTPAHPPGRFRKRRARWRHAPCKDGHVGSSLVAFLS